MNTERIRIWLGFVVVGTVWGSTWIAIKIGLNSVPPFIAAGLRFAVATVIVYGLVRFWKIPIHWSPEAKRLYLALGVLSYSIPFALVYWGQQFIPGGLSSILFAVYPFWVAIFSHLMLENERLDLYKIVGIILGFGGLLVIFAGDIHWTDASGFIGMSTVMISTVLQAYTLILIKKHGQPISPLALNLMGMSQGAIVLLVLGALVESYASIVWDASAIGSILYLSIIGSVLTFVTYYWLLKRIEAVYLSLTSFINPIVAVVLGAVILNESLPPTVFAGATLVLIGIIAANGKALYAKLCAATS